MKRRFNPKKSLGRPLAALAATGGAALGPWLAPSVWGGRQRPGEPPLLRGNIPLLGNALPFSHNATRFLADCRREHGDVFTVYVARSRMTFVCDPLSYSTVLRCPALQFEPVADEVMERAFAFPNIRTEVDLDRLDGTARKYLKGEHLGEISERMCGAVHEFVRDGGNGQLEGASGELPLYHFIWDAIFTAGTNIIFGHGMACPAVAQAFQDFDRDFPTLVAGMPKFLARDGVAGLDALAQPLSELGEAPSKWLRERQKVILDLDAKRRGHAHSAALWAVHANTIPAVFWTLAHLLNDPAATAAVCDELGVGRTAADAPVTVDELGTMSVLQSAAQESLRITTGSMAVRRATEDTTIETRSGTFAVRAGDQVCMAPQLTHHDPTVFEDPEAYRYDRFLDRGEGLPQFHKEGERAGFAFMPFGAGKHTCPGRFFAINEVKIMTATLLRQFAFEPIDGPLPPFDYRRVGLGVFPPNDELVVRWRRRDA